MRLWHFLAFAIGGCVRRIFNFSYDMSGFDQIEGPVILIPNHACKWDPVLTGVACKGNQGYYVVSEHLDRMPVAGKLIRLFFNPISKKKGTTDLAVVRECFRHLRAGHSICLFAEGDQTWDGISGKVQPATGQLVKLSNATLVTLRLEGAFLTRPRWSGNGRRGRIEARIAGIYPPEEIRKMSAEEILCAINRDLYFDFWAWQRSVPGGPIAFKPRGKKKNSAKGMDMLFFMCPGCGSIGRLKTEAGAISCECGFRAKMLDTGFLEPAFTAPDHPVCDFTALPGWDGWQKQELGKTVGRILADGSEETLFEDGPAVLSGIGEGHRENAVSEGKLSLRFCGGQAVLSVGESSFDMKDIKNMGLILNERMLFSYGEGYYEIRTEGINIRKYLLAWEQIAPGDR